MSRAIQPALTPARDMSVTDLAYAILKKSGKAMYYKDLIDNILQTKSIAAENQGRLIAQIHTEINLDTRFLHQGQGEWGLRDWAPKTPARGAKPGPAKVARAAKAARILVEFDDLDEDERDARDERDEEEKDDEYREEEEDNLGQEPDPARDAEGDEWD